MRQGSGDRADKEDDMGEEGDENCCRARMSVRPRTREGTELLKVSAAACCRDIAIRDDVVSVFSIHLPYFSFQWSHFFFLYYECSVENTKDHQNIKIHPNLNH